MVRDIEIRENLLFPSPPSPPLPPPRARPGVMSRSPPPASSSLPPFQQFFRPQWMARQREGKQGVIPTPPPSFSPLHSSINNREDKILISLGLFFFSPPPFSLIFFVFLPEFSFDRPLYRTDDPFSFFPFPFPFPAVFFPHYQTVRQLVNSLNSNNPPPPFFFFLFPPPLLLPL